MRRRRKKKMLLILGVFCLLICIVFGVLIENSRQGTEKDKANEQVFIPFLFREIVYELHPFYAYLSGRGGDSSPIADYLWDHADSDKIKKYHLELLEKENEVAAIEQAVLEEENASFFIEKENKNRESLKNEEEPETKYFINEFCLTAGSGFVSNVESIVRFSFRPEEMKRVSYKKEDLHDFKYVMEHFYTVDASTSPVALNELSELLAYDCSVDKQMEGPHILIYHTHSQEGFRDSVQSDANTLIQGAGKLLAEILREEYGYSVYHHTGCYDIDTRDDAYAKAAPALEEILAQYPQIQVVIDLHRDGVAENRHLVQQVQGVPMAQFMFFNGLSYSNKKGELSYLPNASQMANLALSLKLGIAAKEYYPGLTRDNYLNAYRYNMHYRDKSLLIELGAQTNTVEEIRNACYPLAHILDLVFSGKETYQ